MAAKKKASSSKKDKDLLTVAGKAVTDAAEKTLGKGVNVLLDVVEGTLNALNPFSK